MHHWVLLESFPPPPSSWSMTGLHLVVNYCLSYRWVIQKTAYRRVGAHTPRAPLIACELRPRRRSFRNRLHCMFEGDNHSWETKSYSEPMSSNNFKTQVTFSHRQQNRNPLRTWHTPFTFFYINTLNIGLYIYYYYTFFLLYTRKFK